MKKFGLCDVVAGTQSRKSVKGFENMGIRWTNRWFQSLICMCCLANIGIASSREIERTGSSQKAVVESSLKTRAESGDALAQFEYGRALLQTLPSTAPLQGVAEANKWLNLSERQGYVPAKAYVAFLLVWSPPPQEGRDYGKARRLAEEGAAADDPFALQMLSSFYQLGQGVEKDMERAYFFEQRAADRGWIKAQVDVAKRYLRGEGVDKDPHEAERYLDLAAQGGDVGAQTLLGSLYASGSYGVPTNTQKAVSWLEQAANSNSADAQYLLADLYCEGVGVTRSVSRGKNLLQKAKVQGHKEADNALKQCGAKK